MQTRPPDLLVDCGRSRVVVPPVASSANLQQVVTASLEALTKAALSESQAVSIELLREMLAEQKRGVAASQASSQAALNALSSKVDTLSSNMVALNSKQDSLIKMARAQNLHWAIQSITDGKLSGEIFQYIDNGRGMTSAVLVKAFLLTFVRGFGDWVSNDCYIGTKDDPGREAFRTKLSTHIHVLTGCKPRFNKEMNGKVEQWAIYRE